MYKVCCNMFMVNKLSRALIYKSCNKYFWRKRRKEITNFPETKVYLPDIYKHTLTHTHTPTQYFGGFYTCYLGHKLSTVPLHSIEKGTKKKIPILPSPHKSRKPSLHPWCTKCMHNGGIPPATQSMLRQMSPAQSLHWHGNRQVYGTFPNSG